MLVRVVCGGLIVLILFALVAVIPANLNQRQKGETPTFSMGEMVGITVGGVLVMGILAIIAFGGHKEEGNAGWSGQ